MDLEAISLSGYKFKNWSRTYECEPELLFIPRTVDEIREILYLAKNEKKRIRVVGCGNSPSDLCCSNDFMISMEMFNKIISIDRQKCLVNVEAGIHLEKLNHLLEENDLALPILGSISDSTLAGVISVGTHGTGYRTGIIADYVIEMRLITPTGDLIYCSKREDDPNVDIFNSVLCGLGALGIIVDVTIQCEPKFYLHQLTYPNRLDTILDRLDENVESCDFFRFLYFPHTDYVSVSITNKINASFLNQFNPKKSDHNSNYEIDFEAQYKLTSERNLLQKIIDWIVNYGIGYHFLQFAYWLSTFSPKMVPIINRFSFWLLYSSNQVKLDISYKVFNFECLFAQHVNEWSIPRNKTSEALRELREVIDNNEIYAHFPIEVRFVRQSNIYLAPNYGRDSTYINIISYKPYGKHVDHSDYWKHYEQIMKRNGGRPHWAKDHKETAVDLVRMYPYFRHWANIRKRLDPNRLLFNSYLDRIFSTFPTTIVKTTPTTPAATSTLISSPLSTTTTEMSTTISKSDIFNDNSIFETVKNGSEQN